MIAISVELWTKSCSNCIRIWRSISHLSKVTQSELKFKPYPSSLKEIFIFSVEQCTPKRFAILFGLLTICLIVVVTILAVDNAMVSADLKDARVKMEMLESYIQNVIPRITTLAQI